MGKRRMRRVRPPLPLAAEEAEKQLHILDQYSQENAQVFQSLNTDSEAIQTHGCQTGNPT
jgi:hypothetical protein